MGSARLGLSSISAWEAVIASPCNHPTASCFTSQGEFLEVNPPSRLVDTFRWEEPDPDDQETVVKLSVDSLGDATEVSLWQDEFATEARFALHRSGWTDNFEKLRVLIESGA